jgi:hypothetical protein
LKELGKDVERVFRGIGEHGSERTRLGLRQRLEHRGSEGGVDGLNVLGRRATSDLNDTIELVHGRSTREHGFATKKLTKDAANRPKVDALSVIGRAK